MVLRKTGLYISLFLVVLSACHTHYVISKKEAQHQSLKSTSSSATYDSIIGPYKKTLQIEMEKPLVMCTTDLTKDGDEMTLGNFICDAVKWAYDSLSKQNSKVIVLMNRGGLRSNINKGMITVNSIFEVMPFDNELEVVTINGKQLEIIIDRVLEKKHAFSGMMIHAEKNDHAVTVAGQAIQPEGIYAVLTSDFLVDGGDGFTFGKNLQSQTKLQFKIRDAIINYCMHLKYTGKTINAYKDGRLEISK